MAEPVEVTRTYEILHSRRTILLDESRRTASAARDRALAAGYDAQVDAEDVRHGDLLPTTVWWVHVLLDADRESESESESDDQRATAERDLANYRAADAERIAAGLEPLHGEYAPQDAASWAGALAAVAAAATTPAWADRTAAMTAAMDRHTARSQFLSHADRQPSLATYLSDVAEIEATYRRARADVVACDRDCASVAHMTGGRHRTDCALADTGQVLTAAASTAERTVIEVLCTPEAAARLLASPPEALGGFAVESVTSSLPADGLSPEDRATAERIAEQPAIASMTITCERHVAWRALRAACKPFGSLAGEEMPAGGYYDVPQLMMAAADRYVDSRAAAHDLLTAILAHGDEQWPAAGVTIAHRRVVVETPTRGTTIEIRGSGSSWTITVDFGPRGSRSRAAEILAASVAIPVTGDDGETIADAGAPGVVEIPWVVTAATAADPDGLSPEDRRVADRIADLPLVDPAPGYEDRAVARARDAGLFGRRVTASNLRPGHLEIWTDADITVTAGAARHIGVVTLALRDIVSGPRVPAANDPREWVEGPLREYMIGIDEAERGVVVGEIMRAVAEVS